MKKYLFLFSVLCIFVFYKSYSQACIGKQNDTIAYQTGILVAYSMEYNRGLYFVPTKQLNCKDYKQYLVESNIEKAFPLRLETIDLRTYNILLSAMDTIRTSSGHYYMTPVYIEYATNVYPDFSYLRPDDTLYFETNKTKVIAKINLDILYLLLKVIPLKPYQYKEIIKPEDIPIM